MLSWCLACQDAIPVVPQHLLGTWVTDDPRFAGRTFEITHTHVKIVQEQGGQPVVESIHKIERKPVGRNTLFTFYTRDDADPDQKPGKIIFEYDPGDDGVIHFKNQAPAWKKRVEPLL